MLNESIKNDFPILKRQIHGKRLVYLDNAATSQSPKVVIDSLVDFYSNHRANVHRGVHTLSEEATEMYDTARRVVASFINAKTGEITFVRNTTEATNIVALSCLPVLLKKGDTIFVSESEHHSNLIPWQIAAKALNLNLKVIPLNEDFSIDYSVLKNADYKFLALGHVSNFLGSITPLNELIKLSHKKGARVFIDGAQAVPHMGINVRNLDCDFYAFSGHKVYGPFGIGVLYLKKELLDIMPPFLTGGGIIKQVTISSSTFLEGVEKYEAGTPNVSGAIALGTALQYVKQVGMKDIENHERDVLGYLLEKLLADNDIDVYGPKKAEKRLGLVSFNLKGVHSHDLASVMDMEGVAVRSGHHCAMPAHTRFNVTSSVRASLALYNFKEDVDKLMGGIDKAKKLLL